MGNVLCCDGQQLVNRGHFSPVSQQKKRDIRKSIRDINNLRRENYSSQSEDYENDEYFT